MQKYLLVALGAALLLAATTMLVMHHKTNTAAYPKSVITAFKQWQKQYGKSYSDPDFEVYRLGVFAQNLKKINAHPTSASYTLAVNKFADLTKAEFKHFYLGLLNVPKTKKHSTFFSKKPVNQSIDWTTKGAVTEVKDQGQCGSCWAFSTTGSLESCSFLAGQGLPLLSEQQLVDCSGAEGNQGCNGGLMDYAFQFVIDNKGITTEDQYPYTAMDGNCDTSVTSAFTISSFQDVPSGDCNSLQNAILQQPISIGVDAEEWQFYSGGVFSDCGDQLDHGVLAVGFDDSGVWKVKNSWGADWGENGYIQLAADNTCGICNTASFPIA